jgi:hypothetical protein
MDCSPWIDFSVQNKEELIQLKFKTIEERLIGGNVARAVYEEASEEHKDNTSDL